VGPGGGGRIGTVLGHRTPLTRQPLPFRPRTSRPDLGPARHTDRRTREVDDRTARALLLSIVAFHANSLMAAPAPSYDLVILLHASAEEQLRQKLAVDIDKLIQEQGSLLEGREWGVRQLAYPINDEATAEYRVFRFKGPAELLVELDRLFNNNDSVLRHRIIKLERNPVDLPDLAEIDANAVAAGAAVAAAEEA
jgi:small subunit ribosomal protein S6